MGILYILLGTAFGAIITYLRMNKTPIEDSQELHQLKQKDHDLESHLKSMEKNYERLAQELKATNQELEQRAEELIKLDAQFTDSQIQSEPSVEENTIAVEEPTEKSTVIADINSELIENLKKKVKVLTEEKLQLEIEIESQKREFSQVTLRMHKLEADLSRKGNQFEELNKQYLQEKKDHQLTKEELAIQKDSIRSLGKKFNSDFENIGLKILKELESKQKIKVK